MSTAPRRPDAPARDCNFLTFDIEEWYHTNYEVLNLTQYRGVETNLEHLVDRIIAMCARHGVRTTCFVLGSVGREKPAIVRKLHSAGHEIASHGYDHLSVHSMRPEQFQADLRLSCTILEQITGKPVVGFRAPSFSVDRQSLSWYYKVLEEAGLKYSSSVFPGKTFLYGIPDFPPHVHFPVVSGRTVGVLEVPVPVVHCLGHDLGLSIRLFPAWMICRRVQRDNRAGRSTVIYVHPREIDPEQPRLPLPYPQSVIHYWGLKTCERKLDSLMASLANRSIRMCELLDGGAASPAGDKRPVGDRQP